MRIGNSDLIEEGTLTDMSINIESVPILLQHIANYSIQLVFDGTPEGTLKLQVSNDEGHPSSAPNVEWRGINNWTDVVKSHQSITEAGNHTWEVQNSGTRWVRFIWEAIGGTGTLLSARFNVKGV